MNEYPLITKKEVQKNKTLRNIQKESLKKYQRKKGHFPKAKIGKIVKLRNHNNFLDFTAHDDTIKDLNNLNNNSILNEIQNHHICGLSGSGFLTDQKIQSLINSKAKDKYLIINGVECDPGLIHDEWLINNRFNEIVKGIELLAKCVEFKGIILAIKGETTSKNNLYTVYTVPNRYPMGAEKILVKELLDISLSPDEIPTNKGVLVLNLQTVYAIYEAVYKMVSSKTRLITIADLSTGEAVVARVNMNAKIKDIIAKVKQTHMNLPVYIGSGIMMAQRAETTDVITYKTNFLAYGIDISQNLETKCKKCGACSRKCPMQIKVHHLVQKLEKKDLSNFEAFHPEHCIKCGTCTYFCRAGINAMNLISSLREVSL